jgi:hypothetical protein
MYTRENWPMKAKGKPEQKVDVVFETVFPTKQAETLYLFF